MDSGTYNYTAFPDLRNDFRSVKSHNTLQLSNLEQNKFIGGGGEFLFWLIENGKSELILLEHNKIIAKHDFFGVDYVRTIELISDEIIILEQLKSEKEKYIRIILDSKVEVSCINIHTLMLKNEDISIYIEFKNESPKVVKTKISPYYGELVETNLILVK